MASRMADSVEPKPIIPMVASGVECRIGCGMYVATELKFLLQTIHHLDPGVRIFRVTGIFIVTGAACEVGAHRMLVPWEGAVRNAIAILVEIAPPIAFEFLEILFP